MSVPVYQKDGIFYMVEEFWKDYDEILMKELVVSLEELTYEKNFAFHLLNIDVN